MSRPAHSVAAFPAQEGRTMAKPGDKLLEELKQLKKLSDTSRQMPKVDHIKKELGEVVKAAQKADDSLDQIEKIDS
jgi:hypothetical protein